MVFKNPHSSSGFTFVEIVLSIVLLAMLATPILVSQFQILNRVVPLSSRLEMIFSLESFLAEQQLLSEQKPVTEKTIPSLDLKLRCERKAVSDKSSLKDFKDLQVVKVQGEWNFAGSSYKDSLIAFAYKPTPTGEKK
jgi:type II secretory pathway pseudopilin PulG